MFCLCSFLEHDSFQLFKLYYSYVIFQHWGKEEEGVHGKLHFATSSESIIISKQNNFVKSAVALGIK